MTNEMLNKFNAWWVKNYDANKILFTNKYISEYAYICATAESTDKIELLKQELTAWQGLHESEQIEKAQLQKQHDDDCELVRIAALECATMQDKIDELVKALKDLIQDTQHSEHICGDTEYCPVYKAREALAKVKDKK